MKGRLIFIFLTFVLCLTTRADKLPVGKRVYTVQVGSFESKEKAFNLLQKIKEFPYARVSYKKGSYKVRVGLFKNYKQALNFVNSPAFKRKIKDFYVAVIKFSPKNVYFAHTNETKSQNKTFNAKEKRVEIKETEKKLSSKVKVEAQNQTQSQEEKVPKVEIQYKDFVPLPSTGEKEIKKTAGIVESLKNQNYEPSYLKRFVRLIGLFLLISGGLAYVSYVFILKRSSGINDLEVLVAKFLEEENCEKLKEILVPIVKTSEDNTFLRKALVDCYLKEKKFIEAAALCEEISEILRKEGLEVLADSFKAKAEEFLGKEFRGG